MASKWDQGRGLFCAIIRWVDEYTYHYNPMMKHQVYLQLFITWQGAIDADDKVFEF